MAYDAYGSTAAAAADGGKPDSGRADTIHHTSFIIESDGPGRTALALLATSATHTHGRAAMEESGSKSQTPVPHTHKICTGWAVSKSAGWVMGKGKCLSPAQTNGGTYLRQHLTRPGHFVRAPRGVLQGCWCWGRASALVVAAVSDIAGYCRSWQVLLNQLHTACEGVPVASKSKGSADKSGLWRAPHINLGCRTARRR
jgi:hypothetical protein